MNSKATLQEIPRRHGTAFDAFYVGRSIRRAGKPRQRNAVAGESTRKLECDDLHAAAMLRIVMGHEHDRRGTGSCKRFGHRELTAERQRVSPAGLQPPPPAWREHSEPAAQDCAVTG